MTIEIQELGSVSSDAKVVLEAVQAALGRHRSDGDPVVVRLADDTGGRVPPDRRADGELADL